MTATVLGGTILLVYSAHTVSVELHARLNKLIDKRYMACNLLSYSDPQHLLHALMAKYNLDIMKVALIKMMNILLKEEWKYASMKLLVQSVMMAGMNRMLLLSATDWDIFPFTVSYCTLTMAMIR